MRYQRCYEILGVDGDCDWRGLRLAYRRRIHACHPDRGAAPDSRAFTDLVRAWRLLADYRRRHGRLPDPGLQVDDGHLPQPEPAAQRMPAVGAVLDDALSLPFRWRILPGYCHAAIAGFLVIVGMTVASSLPLEAPKRPAAKPSATLALGMRPEEVLDLQGVPQFTYGSVWFYGESGIVFADGCVVGWEDLPPYALATRERMRRAERKAGARSFCEPDG